MSPTKTIGGILVTLSLFAAIFGLSSAMGTAAAEDYATVTVKHRIPGTAAGQILFGDPFALDFALPVDVYVNGVKAFTFSFPDTVGPIELPAGTYTVMVKLAGTDVTVIGPVTLTLEGGDDVTVVAVLQGPRGPTLLVE